MATIKEITTMCKAGQVQEAYDLAKADLEQFPTDPWVHRGMGWALYYLMKGDTDTANFQGLIDHLDEMKELSLLTVPNDNILFDNVLFKLAGFIKQNVPPNDVDSPAKLSTLFSKLIDYDFEPSKGYSFLLSVAIKCKGWNQMADFIDWWNLGKLTQEDYTPFQTEDGKKMMTLAERAFIAQSKALLLVNDHGRIEEFLPKLANLMDAHPDMVYPGFFYGKLLLSLGNNPDEALKVIVPFARKKVNEFWVWQLLSDVFVGEPDKQLACLIRAVNCHTKENFLGKVRIKLATLYIQRNMLDYAKFQIDKVTQCCLSEGWRLPYEVECWIHQPWINSVTPNDKAPLDFKSITDKILCEGTEEAVAIVTFVDDKNHKASLVYGKKKSLKQRLHIKCKMGDVLKINFTSDQNGEPRVLRTERTKLPDNLDFAKLVEGTVSKKEEQAFAFLKTNKGDVFISPNVTSHYKLQGGETVDALIVYDYNRKKENWNWTCVSINKK